MKHREISFFSLALLMLAAQVTPAAGSVAAWDRNVTAMDLAALSRTVGQPGQPAWPLLRTQGKPSPELTLAIKLLRKIEATEAASTAFDPDSAPALCQAYLDLAQKIRVAGGYDNLLLADTLDRLAMVRLGRWAVDRPADLPRIRQVVATLSPIITPATFPVIAQAEANLQPADFAPARPIATNPVQRPFTVHPSEELEMQIQSAFYKQQQAAQRQPGIRQSVQRQPLSPDRGGQRTIHLLRSPNFQSLIARMRGRDYLLIVHLPGVLQFAENGGTLAMIRDDSKRAVSKVNNGRPADIKSDLFSDTRPDMVPVLRTIAYPGVGTYFGNVHDFIYANAIDPPAQTTGQVSLTVTEKVLTKLDPEVANVSRALTTPSGRMWAALQTIPPKPGAVVPTSRVVINGQAGPEVAIMPINFGRFALTSERGEKIAYIGGDSKAARVYVNHIPGPAFTRIIAESLMFSDDGQVVAYIASDATGLHVVVGANRHGPYANVSCLTISGDGKRAGWIATPAANGRPAQAFPGSQPAVGVPPAAPPASVFLDGKVIAAAAHVEPVFGTRMSPPEFANRRMYAQNLNRVVVSADGSRWAYMAQTPEGLVTRVQGRNPVDYRFPAAPMAFSPDAATLLSFPFSPYGIVINGAPVAGLGGEMNNWVAYAEPPFGPDGTVRFRSFKHSGSVRADGTIIATYPGSCFFSPSGKRVVAPVGPPSNDPYQDPRRKVSYDLGNGRATKPAGGSPNGLSPVFGPDDRFYLIAEVDEHIEMIAEGDAWPAASQVGLLMHRDGGIAFNPDGRYVAASVRRGWAWRLAVNGCETNESYDQVLAGVQFGPSGLRSLAIRDDNLIELNVTITDIKPQKAATNLPSAAPGQATPATTRPGVATTLPSAPGQPATPAQPTVVHGANQWQRHVVIANTRSPELAAFAIGGQPAIVHLNIEGAGKVSLVITQRRNGRWLTTPIDHVPATIRQFAAVAIDDVVYVAMSHTGDDRGMAMQSSALRVVAGRGGKWAVEWDGSDSSHYGGRPAMGIAAGQPFVLFTGSHPRSAAWSPKAIFASRDKAGKWKSEGVPLPHNAGIQGFVAGEVEQCPAFSYNLDGGHPRQFAIRRNDTWSVEPIKGLHRAGAVLNEAGGPAVVGNVYAARKADGWNVEPMYDQSKETVVGMDGAVVEGVSTLVYLVRGRNEMHLRRRINGAWDDQLIDYGATNSDAAVAIVPLQRGFGIAYVAVGPSGTEIVWLEQKR